MGGAADANLALNRQQQRRLHLNFQQRGTILHLRVGSFTIGAFDLATIKEDKMPNEEIMIQHFKNALCSCVSSISPVVRMLPHGAPTPVQEVIQTIKVGIGSLLQRFLALSRIRNEQEEGDLLFVGFTLGGVSFAYESKGYVGTFLTCMSPDGQREMNLVLPICDTEFGVCDVFKELEQRQSSPRRNELTTAAQNLITELKGTESTSMLVHL